jgi:hypothetical protein
LSFAANVQGFLVIALCPCQVAAPELQVPDSSQSVRQASLVSGLGESLFRSFESFASLVRFSKPGVGPA